MSIRLLAIVAGIAFPLALLYATGHAVECDWPPAVTDGEDASDEADQAIAESSDDQATSRRD